MNDQSRKVNDTSEICMLALLISATKKDHLWEIKQVLNDKCNSIHWITIELRFLESQNGCSMATHVSLNSRFSRSDELLLLQDI